MRRNQITEEEVEDQIRMQKIYEVGGRQLNGRGQFI